MCFELGHHIVWYMHGYECFGGAFWFCLHRPSVDGSRRSGQIVCADQIRLHSPINEKTSVSNLNIIHFSCIVSLCYMYTCEAIHSPVILHYTVV